MTQTAHKADDNRAVVLFDGVCNFCNASVRFVIARDPAGHFHFAPLQSQVARRLLEPHPISSDALDSIVLVEASGISTRSAAILRIARKLRFPWPLVYYLFIWIPKSIRDAAYDTIARHRYRWFGQSDTCPIPGPDAAARFIADR